jgi:transketolase
MNIQSTTEFARCIRIESLKMVHRARASHIGGALSMADLLAVLYRDVLNIDPEDPEKDGRDRFILSKGHSCVSLYAALALSGFFEIEELKTYGQDGSRLMSHISHKVPGVEFSTGSLGHGLPFGAGKALAAKRQKKMWRTFVLLGDGELDEGSNWEAIMFAAHHRLDNLVALIDYNKIQSLGNTNDIIYLEPLRKKFEVFGWRVREINGHDCEKIEKALLEVPYEEGRPSCLIANTVKGRGVSYMENELAWHYKSPDDQQLKQAIFEIAKV